MVITVSILPNSMHTILIFHKGLHSFIKKSYELKYYYSWQIKQVNDLDFPHCLFKVKRFGDNSDLVCEVFSLQHEFNKHRYGQTAFPKGAILVLTLPLFGYYRLFSKSVRTVSDSVGFANMFFFSIYFFSLIGWLWFDLTHLCSKAHFLACVTVFSNKWCFLHLVTSRSVICLCSFGIRWTDFYFPFLIIH